MASNIFVTLEEQLSQTALSLLCPSPRPLPRRRASTTHVVACSAALFLNPHTAMSNLDAFVRSSRPTPHPLATSQEIRDRGSTFLGTLFRAATADEAQKAVAYVKNVLHGSRRATHEISAWRCMVPKPGKSGLGGPDDFELRSGSDDDGEKYAGERVLKTMKAEGAMDAVVIISRWCVYSSSIHHRIVTQARRVHHC